jgi:hypothetical protein
MVSSADDREKILKGLTQTVGSNNRRDMARCASYHRSVIDIYGWQRNVRNVLVKMIQVEQNTTGL